MKAMLGLTAMAFLALAVNATAADAPDVRPASEPEIALVREALDLRLLDEPSARYRSVRVRPLKGEEDSLALCGLVNAKNELGAYEGFGHFWGTISVHPDGKRRATILLVDSLNDLARKECEREGFGVVSTARNP